MTPPDVLAGALAAALVDGDWEPGAMLERLRDALGALRPWMPTLVRAARSLRGTAPDVGDLARWLPRHWAFEAAVAERPTIVRYAAPRPAMAASPWRVPTLATTGELATWLGVGVDALEVLADRRGISRGSPHPPARHYRYTWIAKRTGGHRLIEAPKWRLRTVQRRILDEIVAHIPPHDAAHGFCAGRSAITFAQPHVARPVVVRVDLQAFFASVFAPRVVAILRTAGYPEPLARTLAALCTHRTPADVLAGAPDRDPQARARLRTPHLPQGAPTSGALANLAAYRLDLRVAGLAARLGATYTRYADDLVLSGPRELARAAPTLVARLAAIAHEEGFALNLRKTRVMTDGGRQRIAGIVVNDKLSATRADIDHLRAILHNCARHGPISQNRDHHADFRAHLRGRVAWVHALDPTKGARLQAMFDQISWD